MDLRRAAMRRELAGLALMGVGSIATVVVWVLLAVQGRWGLFAVAIGGCAVAAAGIALARHDPAAAYQRAVSAQQEAAMRARLDQRRADAGLPPE